MDQDPGAWVVRRPVVDTVVDTPVGDPGTGARPEPPWQFANQLERDLIRLQELNVLAVSDELTAAG
jgi:hypothetical protein